MYEEWVPEFVKEDTKFDKFTKAATNSDCTLFETSLLKRRGKCKSNICLKAIEAKYASLPLSIEMISIVSVCRKCEGEQLQIHFCMNLFKQNF